LGIETYLYEYDERPGEYVAGKLQAAIRRSDAMIVLLTKKSRISAYVHQEIGYAQGQGKTIIPLVQPGVPKKTLAMLEGREYIPFDLDDPDSAITSLTNSLHKRKRAKENDDLLVVLVGLGVILLITYAMSQEA